MKVSIQDMRDMEIVKDVRLGNIMHLLFLFSFSSVRRFLECQKLGTFSDLHHILQLIQWVIFE